MSDSQLMSLNLIPGWVLGWCVANALRGPVSPRCFAVAVFASFVLGVTCALYVKGDSDR